MTLAFPPQIPPQSPATPMYTGISNHSPRYVESSAVVADPVPCSPSSVSTASRGPKSRPRSCRQAAEATGRHSPFRAAHRAVATRHMKLSHGNISHGNMKASPIVDDARDVIRGAERDVAATVGNAGARVAGTLGRPGDRVAGLARKAGDMVNGLGEDAAARAGDVQHDLGEIERNVAKAARRGLPRRRQRRGRSQSAADALVSTHLAKTSHDIARESTDLREAIDSLNAALKANRHAAARGRRRLIMGLMIGAVLTYHLDPEHGSQRRTATMSRLRKLAGLDRRGAVG